MNIEVEQKFPVTEIQVVEQQLVAAGARFARPVVQVDRYFAHPARDFAQTDEALRIRQSGQRTVITYKGPKLDQATKSREEIELPLPSADSTVDDFAGLLVALGFSPVAEVRKTRRTANLQRGEWSVEAAIDDVERLGSFVELEVTANEETLEAARDCVASLAAELGLSGGQRRSYLELLLELPPPNRET